MRSRARRSRITVATVAVVLLSASSWIAPGPVAASTGPYTLPFFSPESISQNYGCTTYTNEPAFTTGTNADGTAYDCPHESPAQYHFHKANDYTLASATAVAAAAQGTVVARYNSSTGSTCGTVSEGNYLLIQHDSTHYTMYYHLKQNTLLFVSGDQVSAGQQIAQSDNSGNSCGAHLHYQLQKCICTTSTTTVSKTYQLDGKWTIDTQGRVPWLANFASQISGGTAPPPGIDW